MAPKEFWMRQYIRMTQTADYKSGQRLAALSRHTRRQRGADGAVPQDGDESTERSLSHGDD